jgi:hypothetical protein
MIQCKGKTLEDTQCKRMVKEGEYCYNHKKTANDPNDVQLDTPPAPHEVGGRYLIELPPNMVLPQKCLKKLKSGPTKKDSPGHIYIYTLLSDERESNSYWKIGRTTQTVEKRLSQWPGSKLKTSFPVKYNKFAEALIHRILQDCRIYRYEYNTGKKKKATRFHSVYVKSKLPVEDTQSRAEDIESGTFKLHVYKKHIEWFINDWKVIKKVVKSVVKYTNALE